MGTGYKPAEIARQGINKGRKDKVDYVIVDTSGRLQIDKTLMNELKETKRVRTLTLTLSCRLTLRLTLSHRSADTADTASPASPASRDPYSVRPLWVAYPNPCTHRERERLLHAALPLELSLTRRLLDETYLFEVRVRLPAAKGD